MLRLAIDQRTKFTGFVRSFVRPLFRSFGRPFFRSFIRSFIPVLVFFCFCFLFLLCFCLFCFSSFSFQLATLFYAQYGLARLVLVVDSDESCSEALSLPS